MEAALSENPENEATSRSTGPGRVRRLERKLKAMGRPFLDSLRRVKRFAF
jgi:hypothetical protein